MKSCASSSCADASTTRKRRAIGSRTPRSAVKTFGGERVNAGQILVRQRGTQVHPGANVGMGRDHTLFARVAGQVLYAVKGEDSRKTVSIVPA